MAATAPEAAPSCGDELYYSLRQRGDLREPYRIPSVYLRSLHNDLGPDVPETPVIAFINSRSGGRQGEQLALALSRALGRSQVFDLSSHTPSAVLSGLWAALDARERCGDAEAAHIRRTLRIVAAGGDGTIAWVLNSISQLGLDPAPPVAILPLGTGNDLSRTLGWGKRFNPAWVRDHDGLYRTMLRVATAQPAAMDFWAVSVSVPQALLQQKPHCLQAVSPSAPAASGDDEEASRPPTPRLPVSVAPGDAAAAAGAASSSGSGGSGKSALPTALLRGGFWNYLSIGLDAQAAHGFHSLRESSPHLASGQYVNMFWYSWFTCASGWFCCAPPLCNKVEVEAQAPRGPDGAAGEWRRVKVPRSVRALVLLNLQSYAGGSNLWGKTAAHGGEGGCAPPSYSDGALELVGLEDGWRAALVVGTSSLTGMHAKRLGQARAVRIKLKAVVPTPDGVPLPSYLQLDGEPWMQHVPSGAADEPVVIEVRHGGLSRVLSNQQGPGRRAMPPTAAAAAAATGGGGAHKASPAAAQPQETKQVAVSAAAASSEAVQLAVVQAVVSDS